MALAQTARVVIEGTTRTSEIWQTGCWVENVAVASQADADAFASAVHDDFVSELLGTVRAMLPDNASCTAIKVYCYPTGGTTATYISEVPVSSGTGTGGHNLPEQICMVATLLTGVAGRRNRGRMYFPAFGVAIAADNQFDSTLPGALADALAAWFTDIASINAPSPVVVYSVAGSAVNPVVTVRVDSKPDIQRRRVNREAATSTASAAV